ncbi:MAG: proline racemase family protein [Chthonomonadaceae bacterium]|nr:proline racemase family protein [Chthonomonadaceae bacterium]
MKSTQKRIQVVDSHTGGEPTRVVVSGAPLLKGATTAEMLHDFRTHHDDFRSAVINEPRGNDILVGALLLPPTMRTHVASIIFFNNVGYLGMCGHGMIGLVTTLAHLDMISVGTHAIETPIGSIKATLHDDGSVAVRNVPAYRHTKDVRVQVEGIGEVCGDVAWGGNWFFLVSTGVKERMDALNVDALTSVTVRIREALSSQNITGKDGAQIDHIELFAPSEREGVHSKNFVLCPGEAYDRSPCGTGTSAKLACLYSDGKLASGEIWRQESIIGSIFEGSIEVEEEVITPTIRGKAWLTSEATLLIDESDPFATGIKR